MAEKLDRFTKHARQVLQIAQEEAVRLNHNYVGTEHLRLGLVKRRTGWPRKCCARSATALRSYAWLNWWPAELAGPFGRPR